MSRQELKQQQWNDRFQQEAEHLEQFGHLFGGDSGGVHQHQHQHQQGGPGSSGQERERREQEFRALFDQHGQERMFLRWLHSDQLAEHAWGFRKRLLVSPSSRLSSQEQEDQNGPGVRVVAAQFNHQHH